jgi:hypothetical protein
MGNTEPRRRWRLVHTLTIVVDDSHGYLISLDTRRFAMGDLLAIVSPILSPDF